MSPVLRAYATAPTARQSPAWPETCLARVPSSRCGTPKLERRFSTSKCLLWRASLAKGSSAVSPIVPTLKELPQALPNCSTSGTPNQERWFFPSGLTSTSSESLAYSPDGKRIATTSYESKIKLWDAETGKELLAIPNDGGEAIAFSPDGKRIASPSGQLVKVWDALTGKEVRSIKTGASAGLAFIHDGKRLAIGASGKVGAWQIDKLQGGHTFEAGQAGLSSMALSPDGKRIATASALLDPTVKVWDAQTGKLVFSLKGHGDVADSVAFSRDGKTLASASRDETTRIWDMSTGENKRTLKSGSREHGVVALGPNGDLLATNRGRQDGDHLGFEVGQADFRSACR